jgi:hypothetical protein
MLGARKNRNRLYVVSLLCALTAYAETPGAVELSNILFPPLEKQSREASALAFEAISTAMAALAMIERNNTGASVELFKKSASQLRGAAAQMQGILSLETSNADVRAYLAQAIKKDNVSGQDWNLFSTWVSRLNTGLPNNRKEALAFFHTMTITLANELENPPTSQGTHRPLIDDISDYLKVGEIITRLIR